MAWNRPNGRMVETGKRGGQGKSRLKGLVAGAIVVLGAGLAVWFLTNGEADPGTIQKRGRGAIADKGRKYRKLDEISRVKPRKEYATKPKSVEEALQRVEEAQEPMKFEPMPKADESKPKRKMLFRSGTEQVLSWLCHVNPGELPTPPPPIPDGEMEKLAEILISKNDIAEDDSPEAAEAKQMVDAAKKEMMKFIREGGDPDDFMQYVFREQTKAFESRNLVSEMYAEIVEEDPGMARDFAIKANEKLAEQGIVPIHVPEEEELEEQAQEQQQQED